MPKKIITDETMPQALGLLHSWQGRLTWDLYAKKLAKRLKVDRIAKRSLYKHDEIVIVYKQVQERLKEQAPEEKITDATVRKLTQELEKTQSELAHEKQKVTNLQEALLRLQRNAYMVPGIDTKKLQDLLINRLPDERR
jgi:DNA-directed RNA polymerase specialized sigma24 family protein